MSWRESPAVLGCWFTVLLGCSGCMQLMAPDRHVEQASTLEASPLVQTSPGFYPLDIGNHWRYEQALAIVVVPAGGPPGTPSEFRSSLDVDLVGTEQRFGRDYVVQRETHEEGFELEFLYRQDKEGLYNADPAPVQANRATSAARVQAAVSGSLRDRSAGERNAYSVALERLMDKLSAIRRVARGGAQGSMIGTTNAGPQEGEIVLLQYPLATSKSWHVREDPLVIYTVEGQDKLDLPPGTLNGWRIRIEWPGFFGPNDRVHVWYGREGFLKLEAHLEGTAIDENGNPVGTLISDQSQVLTELSLVSAGS